VAPDAAVGLRGGVLDGIDGGCGGGLIWEYNAEGEDSGTDTDRFHATSRPLLQGGGQQLR